MSKRGAEMDVRLALQEHALLHCCCTRAPVSVEGPRSHSIFILQNDNFFEWSRGGSNP